MEEIEILASKLAEKGSLFDIKSNSIFTVSQLPGGNADLEEIVAQVGIKLRNETSLFRMKINPLLGEYVSAVTDEISRLRDTSEVTKYIIKECTIPSIAEELNSKVSSSLKGSISAVGISFSIPTPETIKDYFKPVGDLKIPATEFLATLSVDVMIEFWNKFLTNISSDNTNYNIFKSGSPVNITDLCLNILAITFLRENQPSYDTTDNTVYRKFMTETLEELKGFLAFAITVYKGEIDVKKVISAIPDRYTVYVNPAVYDEFLKLGGKPETVLGFLLSEQKDSEKYIDTLLNNAAILEGEWSRRYNLCRLESIDLNIRNHKAIHKLYVNKFFNELLPKYLVDYVRLTPAESESKIDELLSGVDSATIVDVEKISRLIFGMVYFASTNYFAFTEYMLSYLKLFKDNDLKKAASFAVLDIILDYLFTQVDVRGI